MMVGEECKGQYNCNCNMKNTVVKPVVTETIRKSIVKESVPIRKTSYVVKK